MTPRGEIREHMTRIPHALHAGQSIAEALARMHRLNIGHLPVLDGGRLVGMLAETELSRACEMGLDGNAVAVAEVMRHDVCSVSPQAPLSDVVRDMASRHSDCCAVVEDGAVIGILTSTDALAILADVLGGRPLGQRELRPSEVRARILREHALLRNVFDDIERLATQACEDEGEDGTLAQGLLRERSRDLCLTLSRHIALENTMLAPALRAADGFGDVRAQQLLDEHHNQSHTLTELMESLDALPIAELSGRIRPFLEALRTDMHHEEHALLNPDLLRDDVIEVSATG